MAMTHIESYKFDSIEVKYVLEQIQEALDDKIKCLLKHGKSYGDADVNSMIAEQELIRQCINIERVMKTTFSI